MSRVFTAEWRGRCTCCNERFEAGEDVCYEDDELVLADHAVNPEY